MRPFIIPIFIPHMGCPHRCVFCDQTAITGHKNGAPSPQQVQHTIRQFLGFKGRRRGPVEAAFFGGNFLGLPASYQESLLDTAQGFVEKGLVESIRFSTRPDTVTHGALDRQLTAFYEHNAYIAAHGRNIVNVILVDFRALDTLGETTVVAVAGLGAMQVMMLAVAMYAGDYYGMDAQLRSFMRWISLLLTLPVVLYSASSFFITAWRDLKRRQLSMEVPVSLAIGGAFAASIWSTLTAGSEVYFDSVCMFAFFLLASRYLEMGARHRAGQAADAPIVQPGAPGNPQRAMTLRISAHPKPAIDKGVYHA